MQFYIYIELEMYNITDEVNKIKPTPMLIWTDYKILHLFYHALFLFKKLFFILVFHRKLEKNIILYLIII